MADKRFSEAVKSIVAKIAGAPPAGVAIQYPNQVGWQQPANAPWSRVTVTNTASTNVAVGAGSSWVRRNGLIVVDVFTPQGSGINSNLSLCEAFIALLENTEFGNVKTFEANTAKIEDSPWLGYQVTINFYCEGF